MILLHCRWAETISIRQGGQVVCWGESANYRTGDGATADNEVPNNVSNLSDVIAISAGYEHTCAIRRGGQAVCSRCEPSFRRRFNDNPFRIT